VKPFTIEDLVPAIEIAFSRYQQLLALQVEISDLTERLETRKLVDQAKGILMKAMNLSEPEAFKWIQKSAMDRRVTMKEISLAILDPNQATTVLPKLNK